MSISVSESSVLLFGSPSLERRVSVASAQFMASQLQVRLWFWTPDGRVREIARDQLESHLDPFTNDFAPSALREWSDVDAALDTLVPESDVVIIGVHGEQGEDGDLQRRLEARRLAFTGSGSRASAVAFNKSEALAIARANGVRTAAGRVLLPRAAAAARAAVLEAFAALGPMVVKAESGGSSIMLAFVRSSDDCEKAIALVEENPAVAFRAESIVEGREFTVGIIELGDRELALPCSEVVMQTGYTFDYAGKYLGAGSLEITPADIPAALRDRLQETALAMHRLLGCAGYSRSDFMVDAEGPVYLETNTLPGLTRRSFIPQQLEQAKIAFEEFLRAQIVGAQARRVSSSSAQR